MGAQNVGLVYARWGALNHAPFRVLAYMALRSLDSGNPPIFYAGRDELASAALGRPIPEPGPEFEKQRKSDWAMVKKITRELYAAGAISLVQAAGPDQNAVYKLNLAGIEKGYPQEDGATSGSPSGGTSGSPKSGNGGTSGSPSGATSGSPLGVSKSIKAFRGAPRIIGNPDQPPHALARVREDEKPELNSATKADHSTSDCPNCETALDPDGSCFVCRTPAIHTAGMRR